MAGSLQITEKDQWVLDFIRSWKYLYPLSL